MTIRALHTSVFHAPNGWSQRPVVLVRIDASEAPPNATASLRDILAQGLGDRPASAEGMWRDFGTIVEGLALEMQQTAGEAVSESASRQVAERAIFDVAVEFHESDVALAAFDLTIRLINSVLSGAESGFDLRREFDAFIGALLVRRIGRFADEAVIRTARERQIPVRIPGPSKRLIEFGLGPYRRRFRSMATSGTTRLGASISSDKSLTKLVLRELGVPVPVGITAGSEDAALAAATTIGYPVVVKPIDGEKGIGVSLNLQSPASVSRAYAYAASLSRTPRVVVERHIPGKEFRILVVADQVAAVCERVPAFVTGDGQHTIRQLVAITNAHPWRGPGANSFLALIAIDRNTIDALESQNLTLDSVPETGQHVAVKLVSNISQGGVPVDRTGDIHPETARLARTAAKAIGIDVCGLDLITSDIDKPLWETGGAFLEVNATPGGRIHLPPHRNVRPDIADAIMDMLFPPGTPSRPRIVVVCGASQAAVTAKLIASTATSTGVVVGLASSQETTVAGRRLSGFEPACGAHVQAVLRHPETQFAVLEIDQPGFEHCGLPFEHCDVAVFLESDDADGVSTLPRSLHQAVLDTLDAAGALILNADLQVPVPERWSQRTVVYSTGRPTLGTPASREAARKTVAVDGEKIVVMGASGRSEVLSVDRLTQALGSAELDPALAAIATAIALDIPAPLIEAALARPSGGPIQDGPGG
ncbi:MAG: acetate--CoA ligase family protein [Thermomicrobiales bacterium]